MKKANLFDDFDFSNADERLELCEDEQFTYGHYNVDTGVITIAGGRVKNTLYFGISMCSPKDNFCKECGRLNAEENLVTPEHSNKRGIYYIPLDLRDDQPALVLKEALSNFINKMKKHPWWIKEKNVTFRRKRSQ